jgi:hypothetical protein
MSRWLTKNELVFFIGVKPWTYTQNNRSSQSCEKNIGHCVMNTKMPFFLEEVDARYVTIHY